MVGKEKYVVVKFYTRWCHYCRMMSGEYDSLFDKMKKREDVIIGRLEGSINQSISAKYGINSFPIVILFFPETLQIKSVYQGMRIAPEMEKWIDSSAPVLVKEKKMLQIMETPNIDPNSHLEQIDLKKLNLTNITDEMEFFRREIISLKQKVETMGVEINNFKKGGDFSSKVLINANNTEYSLLKNLKLESFDLLQFFIFCGVGIFLLAVLFTLKKLIFGNKSIFEEKEKI